MRNIIMIMSVLCAASAYGLFHVKHRVQDLKKDLVVMHQQLVKDKEAVHVLKAEWAYLNQPDRLRRLAETHLAMDYPDSDYIRTVATMADVFVVDRDVPQLAVVPTPKPITVSARSY